MKSIVTLTGNRRSISLREASEMTEPPGQGSRGTVSGRSPQVRARFEEVARPSLRPAAHYVQLFSEGMTENLLPEHPRRERRK